MKIRNLAISLASTIGLATSIAATSSANAEEAFVVNGPVSRGYYKENGVDHYITGGSIEAMVIHDPYSPISYAIGGEGWGLTHWQDATVQIEYTVFDEGGNEVFSYVADADYARSTDSYRMLALKNVADYGWWFRSRQETWLIESLVQNESLFDMRHANVSWSEWGQNIDVSQDLLEVDQYPSVLDNNGYPGQIYFTKSSLNYVDGTTEYFWAKGTIGSVRHADIDIDGDGHYDSEDACPDSLLYDTVFIGEKDSGVENVLLESGCTITDIIFQIYEDEAKYGTSIDEVSLMLNHLKDEGIITGREKGMLQSTVAKTNGKGKKN